MHKSPLITLFEFKPYTYDIGNICSQEKDKITLTKEVRQELENLNAKFGKRCFDIGVHSLRARSLVGVIRTRHATIEVFPKICRHQADEHFTPRVMENLLKMLAYTRRFLDDRLVSSDLAYRNFDDWDFFELFIFLFAHNLLKQLTVNHNMEYLRTTNDLRFVRGRIDFAKYFDSSKRHIVSCTFLERSMDNTINRTLKYVSYLMYRITKMRETSQILSEILAILDQVELERVPLEKIRLIGFNRLNEQFKPYIDFCKIFLQNSALVLEGTGTETISLLIPMERIFEDFAARAISEIIKKRPEVSLMIQNGVGYLARDSSTNRGLFKMVPDIVIGKGNGSTGASVIDTKYKILREEERRNGIAQTDMYQMYAYAMKIANVERIMLLYPRLNDDDLLNLHRNWYFETDSKKRRIELLIRTVDLSKQLKVQAEWNRLINEIESLVYELIPLQVRA